MKKGKLIETIVSIILSIVVAVVEIIWYIKDDDKSVLVLCLALLLPLGILVTGINAYFAYKKQK